ncbi:MAG: hypothetical protein MJK15_06810 [Colwellia sp.]|nr:hypothetical protein [Colwellia sp.]
MIVCNKFVYLHLHKSGGTFINRMMTNCIPYSQQLGYHLPYSKLPATYRRLPVLGTVRNPWAYYVSWYSFQSQMQHPNALFMLLSEDNSLDFEETIFNLLKISRDEKLLQDVIAILPEKFEGHGLNLTKECVQAIKNTGIGFYSFLHDRLYKDAVVPRIIKMENLRNGFSEILTELGVEPQEKIQTFLANAPKINTSEHQAYQGFYPKELKEHIADVDSVLIEQYSYSF